MALLLAALACCLTASTYVGLLYIWRGSLPRDHPSTIRLRLVSTGLTSAMSWVPVYLWAVHYRHVATPVAHLLGLRLQGLAQATIDALLLVVTLFAGPLVYYLHCLEVPRTVSQPPPAAASARRPVAARPGAGRGPGGDWSSAGAQGGSKEDGRGAGGPGGAAGGGSGAGGQDPDSALLPDGRPQPSGGPLGKGVGDGGGEGGEPGLWDWVREGVAEVAAGAAGRVWAAASDLRNVRNLVAAPLTEEWVFRACMVPLLKMEGMSSLGVVFLTPVFFGAAHLHHLGELLRHQRMPLERALMAVAFQFLYTTVFGWLVTFLFLRTGHLAAPVAAHVFCNWAGFPPFGEMAAHPRGPVLLVTTAVGLGLFFMQLGRLTRPEKYGQDFYTW